MSGNYTGGLPYEDRKRIFHYEITSVRISFEGLQDEFEIKLKK